LSDWFWNITPLDCGYKTVQLTDPPYIVRLLDFGRQCSGAEGQTRDERKLALQREFGLLGRKVAIRSFTGILALRKQIVHGSTLVQALNLAKEPLVGFLTLNNKAPVWMAGEPAADNPLDRLPPIQRTIRLPWAPDTIATVPVAVLDFGWEVQDVVLSNR
jgi:hypothetical protein